MDNIFFDFSVNNKELENLLHNFSVFCFSFSVSNTLYAWL